jgi:hypothetical protein
MGTGFWQVIALLLLELALGVPAFVVGRRRGISLAWVAFIPIVGPWITVLRSIGSSAWLTVLTLVPLVDIFFGLWAAFTIPGRHGRNTAWGIWFILPVLNVIGFWAYAFTMPDERAPVAASAASPSG